MAAAIVRLLNDPALRRQMGEAGLLSVRDRFSVERMVLDTLRVTSGSRSTTIARTTTPAARRAAVTAGLVSSDYRVGWRGSPAPAGHRGTAASRRGSPSGRAGTRRT